MIVYSNELFLSVTRVFHYYTKGYIVVVVTEKILLKLVFGAIKYIKTIRNHVGSG